MNIGFIGQGYIGKNYADNYESRGYSIVRYSHDPEHAANKESIKTCSLVFIAVPTPTTPQGFDDSNILSALELIQPGAVAVIKSTMPPTTTIALAQRFPDIYVMHSPEFLSERSARQDVDHPHANIIGVPEMNDTYTEKALLVMETLPKAPYEKICHSTEAEIIKYSRNIHGFYEILFYNMLYDFTKAFGADYDVVKEYIAHDPLHVDRYASPVHASGHTLENPKRGAGGHCFIKDFKAFKNMFESVVQDKTYIDIMSALEQKNIELLTQSKKDLDLLKNVYGDRV